MKAFVAVVLFVLSSVAAGQDVPLFTSDFPPEEFGQRRARIYEAIGPNALAVLQGAPSPQGYVRFRQYNEFYYVCGVEVPHAYILLDGSRKQATVYLPHRNERRERSEGKLLSAEDVELVQKLTGIEGVAASDLLAEHLANAGRSMNIKTLYTPFQPGEGFAMSRDLALRYNADIVSDPFDSRISREGRFIALLKERFPMFDVKDLSPVLDDLRMIKSPREIELIRKATRLGGLALIEGMRSTAPGIMEYELDAMAKYIYYRNGAQGEAYYSLIASGPNSLIGHYNAGKRMMKDGDMLLFDFAPDAGYYMSDVTRVWPVNGKFSPSQRELYSFYLACYKAILKAIRSGVTAQAIKQEVAAEMEKILARTKFSKSLYQEAAGRFVTNYKSGATSAYATLGHWTGMATHDVGFNTGPLKPGMVFTIEPSLVVREENINIRLEDLIIITQNGKEVASEFIPMEIEEIEKLMKEEGMLQRYPADATKDQ
ncbi:MAG: aminopeptidase P family protein [Ignavibacteriales bacterium]|nr:aminopeptidase P family protein [Ignavibacteriales bacterium]